MTKFETLFGIKESEIKTTCILMPILPKGALNNFGIKNLSRGKLYSSGNAKHFTLINTGIGHSFTGDAALYLSDTCCKNVILYGSCGIVRSSNCLNIGSLVTPIECYAMESFTDMLLKYHSFKTFYPDNALLESFLNYSKNIQKVTCATLGSLKLEEEYVSLFAEKNIQAVDMECSSLFSVAAHKHLKAMAIFYVSDIINEKPFYKRFCSEDEIKLFSSIKLGVQFLCSFIK